VAYGKGAVAGDEGKKAEEVMEPCSEEPERFYRSHSPKLGAESFGATD
jgi:hypothetical protein